MSRSRAGEHGEKTNQTLHTERVGLIKTFHTGGERERKRARERDEKCVSVHVCALLCSVGVCVGVIRLYYLGTLYLELKYQMTSLYISARDMPAV